MDPTIVSAMSAVLGSVVGGSASIATAWFTQKTQGRRESVRAEIQKREVLYGEFIAECSRLAIDALDHSLEELKYLSSCTRSTIASGSPRPIPLLTPPAMP